MVPAEQRKRWLVMSDCSTRVRRSIMTYKDKARYLLEKVPFKCRHGVAITNIS